MIYIYKIIYNFIKSINYIIIFNRKIKMIQNLQDEKVISKIKKIINSPMRKLFNLTASIKKLKRNSFEKRPKKILSSALLKYNENKVNKGNDMKNNKHLKKKNQSLVDIKDNNIYNNYLQNNYKNSIFNTYSNNDFIDGNNNYIQLHNNIININNNQYSYKRNTINNNIIKNKKKKERNIKIKYGQKKNDNKNIISSGVFKYKINKNKISHNYNINNSMKNRNKNKLNKNKEYKNNLPEIEMPYSTRYIFSAKKNNSIIKRNKKNNNHKVYNNTERLNKNNKQNENQTINYRNNNININKESYKIMGITEIKSDTKIKNQKEIYSKPLFNKGTYIYSPKKSLNRIHSQDNINTYNKIDSLKYLNLTGFTYKKKNSYYKINNNNNSNYNDNKEEDISYDIKPDIYPEIKINLKNKISHFKNNSVIYENNKINTLANNTYFEEFPKNNSYVYIKTNKINKTFFKDSNNNKDYSFISYLEINYIIILLEKIKDIFDSLYYNNNSFILNYCFEFINYYYNYSIDTYIQNSIINIIDINNINLFNNYFLFSIVIIYALTLSDEKNFDNVKILIKESLKLIYSNILTIINYSIEKEIISRNNLFIENIINNINNKYINNKELYIDDSEYLLINKNNNKLLPEDKLNYNLNFIIRNIHTIINNMKKIKTKNNNYNDLLNIFKQINNTSFEYIYDFYMNNILQINILNSTINGALNKSIKKYSLPVMALNKMYTLIISLDETLLYFKTNNNNSNNKGIIQLRPWLNEFLTQIKPYYDIIIFSNGDKKYTEIILKALKEYKIFFENKLYREHCNIINNDFIKDINRFNLEKTVIVDNLIQNYRLNLDNGINIKSFYGESNDNILKELENILIKIAKYGGDIRKGIKYYKEDIINKISSNVYFNYYK